MIRNVATIHLLCKHTLLLQCLHKLCHRFSRSWECTVVRSIMTCHFDIWRTQIPGLLSPNTCKTSHLSRVPFPSLPHLLCLFPEDKYLYFYTNSSSNRFFMKFHTCYLSPSFKLYHHHHHHHHHVHEGLGVFPVPWSSRCCWPIHLFLGHPTFLCHFGLYCRAWIGSIFVSILCTCCSHFSGNILFT